MSLSESFGPHLSSHSQVLGFVGAKRRQENSEPAKLDFGISLAISMGEKSGLKKHDEKEDEDEDEDEEEDEGR